MTPGRVGSPFADLLRQGLHSPPQGVLWDMA